MCAHFLTTIAYDKGYFFLRYLENTVGRKHFDAFLTRYFDEHAFRSNHTEAFLAYMRNNLFEHYNIDLIPDLDEWIYGEGLPSSMPYVLSERFNLVDKSLEIWQSNKDIVALNTGSWSTFEWLHFIRNLPDSTTNEDLKVLDDAFDLTESNNSEILGLWLVRAVRCWYDRAFPKLRAFLTRTGRRKFLMPLYSELVKTDRGKALAVDMYRTARPNHPCVAPNSMYRLLDYPA